MKGRMIFSLPVLLCFLLLQISAAWAASSPPQVVNTCPAGGAEVAPELPVAIVFDQNIHLTEAAEITIEATDPWGLSQQLEVYPKCDQYVLWLYLYNPDQTTPTPVPTLPEYSSITVTIKGGSIANAAGNQMADDFTLTFATTANLSNSDSPILYQSSYVLQIPRYNPPGPGSKPNPGLSIDKVADNLTPQVGDTVTYTCRVTNAGDVDLTNVQVTDSLFPDRVWTLADMGDTDGVLSVGESVYFSYQHTISATDPDPLGNTATATATYNDQEVSAQDTETVDIHYHQSSHHHSDNSTSTSPTTPEPSNPATPSPGSGGSPAPEPGPAAPEPGAPGAPSAPSAPAALGLVKLPKTGGNAILYLIAGLTALASGGSLLYLERKK